MKEILGFIGTGNMASAIAKAAAAVAEPSSILLANRTREKAERLAAAIGGVVSTNEEAAKKARYLFLGVKPQMTEGVLQQLSPILAGRTDRFVLISMVTGITMERLTELLGFPCPIIRIMPNIACTVSASLTTYAVNDLVTPEEKEAFLLILSKSGTVDALEEPLIDAAAAVAGCGGAFLWQIMEGIADGGVACGLPRQKALLYAAQMMEGTARLSLATGAHPGILKDQVCSPGGSTIQGVRVLEQRGVRGAMMDAVIAAFEKNRSLGNKNHE